MNHPSFTGLITIKDLENFVEEQKKVFDVMHVTNAERVELAVYQLKNMIKPDYRARFSTYWSHHFLVVVVRAKDFSIACPSTPQ